MKNEFDRLDESILKLLQMDGTLSNKQIGAILNKSQTTIFGRRRRLTKLAAIINTRAQLNGKLLGFGIIGFIYLKVLNHSEPKLEVFKNSLLKIKGVCACTSITGQNSMKIKIATSDTISFNLIKNTIANLQDVSVVDSYLELEEIIPDRGFDF
jgi:Lrp/AsnC family leucine-responsive transcriptional regulator